MPKLQGAESSVEIRTHQRIVHSHSCFDEIDILYGDVRQCFLCEIRYADDIVQKWQMKFEK